MRRYITPKGEPRTSRLEISLPLSLFCKIVPPIKASVYKLTIDTSRRGAPLSALFEDLNAIPPSDTEPPPSEAEAPNIISVHYIMRIQDRIVDVAYLSLQYFSGPDVTVIGSKSSGKYRVQSSHFEAMWLLLSELIARLQTYWKEKEKEPKPADSSPTSRDAAFKVSFTEDLPFQVSQ